MTAGMCERSCCRADRASCERARRPRVTKPPDERRREILSAATQLFRERGFDLTTVQAIASKGQMAPGTVYLYFPSKEAILAAIQEEFEAGLLARFAEIAEAVLAEEEASGEIVSYVAVVDRLIDGIVAYGLENRGGLRSDRPRCRSRGHRIR